MCLVQLHKSSKSASYKEMADYSVPARIVTTAYSSSDEKHQRVHIINSSSRRSSVHIPSTTTAVHSSPASIGYIRAQRRNTMSGGPARASYVSSRGAAYHRCTEKFFYGRDSGGPLILSAEDMGSDDHSGDEKSLSDNESTTSSTSTTGGANGSVVIMY